MLLRGEEKSPVDPDFSVSAIRISAIAVKRSIAMYSKLVRKEEYVAVRNGAVKGNKSGAFRNW